MSKLRESMLKIAICCAGYGIISDAIIVPLVTSLFGENGEFPQTGLFIQNYIISGNSIGAIFAIGLSGWLMKYVSKRKLLIAGTTLFFVASVSCAFINNVMMLAILRTLSTASAGILSVVTTALIIEMWRTEKEQGQMFGWYNATSAIFGTIITIASGYAVLRSWRLSFLINAISIF